MNSIDNQDWSKTEIVIQFPPAVNKGYTTLPSFWDKQDNKIRIIPKFDVSFGEFICDLILEVNRSTKVNQISFRARKNEYDNADVEILFNQEIVDNFEANLPKSKKGKITAWYTPISTK